MDPQGHIYEDDLENIPPEDKARLQGFLKGRAEADAKAQIEEKVRKLEAEVERLHKGEVR